MPIKSPAITPGSEPLPEASFYIPATEPTTRLRRAMKRDDCFLVFDSHGDIGASPGGPDGLFNCDTRYLSHFELLINGLQPLLLGSNLSDDNCVLSVDLTNPDIYYDKQLLLQKNLLHVARTVFVWRSTLFHRSLRPLFGMWSRTVRQVECREPGTRQRKAAKQPRCEPGKDERKESGSRPQAGKQGRDQANKSRLAGREPAILE
jgi:hypothetical protein